jgi:hypothetical protein
VSTTDSIAYEIKRGGGVILKESYMVRARKMFAEMPTLRAELRRELRRRVIANLEKATGLPFDLAITNIEAWRETEEDPEPEHNFRIPDMDRSVLLVTTCIVRAVEYPEVRK